MNPANQQSQDLYNNGPPPPEQTFPPFAFKNTFSVTPATFAPTANPATGLGSWMKIEDFATQIRILSLQARVDDSVSVDQLQNAFDLSSQIQEQLRILMQQKTGFSFPTASNEFFKDSGTLDSPLKKRKRGDRARTCQNCSTSETPEWRRGPNGPRTLCNACGLKWAKKRRTEEKRNAPAFVEPVKSETTEPTMELPSLPVLKEKAGQ